MRRIFSEPELERYSRQIILDQIGHKGQDKLCSGKVLIIGAGGLGSPAALYLAAAGVGTIGIVDQDSVGLSNLQRQIMHGEQDIGSPKVESANRAVKRINAGVAVRTINRRVTAAAILELLAGYDFVIDATDNFPAKFLINDACVKTRIPFSHAGVIRFFGQLMTVVPGKSACYRCIFNSLPPREAAPTCSEAGILGTVAGIVGTLQATEAIKFLTGAGSVLLNSLLTFDALSMDFRKIQIKKNDSCAVCSIDPANIELKDEIESP